MTHEESVPVLALGTRVAHRVLVGLRSELHREGGREGQQDVNERLQNHNRVGQYQRNAIQVPERDCMIQVIKAVVQQQRKQLF